MKIIIIFVLMILACWLAHHLLEAILNYRELRKHKKDYSSPHFREGSGIVFNKKTGKLEETGGKHILPFD